MRVHAVASGSGLAHAAHGPRELGESSPSGCVASEGRDRVTAEGGDVHVLSVGAHGHPGHATEALPSVHAPPLPVSLTQPAMPPI